MTYEIQAEILINPLRPDTPANVQKLQNHRGFDERIINAEWQTQFICFEITTKFFNYPHRTDTAVNMDRRTKYFEDLKPQFINENLQVQFICYDTPPPLYRGMFRDINLNLSAILEYACKADKCTKSL